MCYSTPWTTRISIKGGFAEDTLLKQLVMRDMMTPSGSMVLQHPLPRTRYNAHVHSSTLRGTLENNIADNKASQTYKHIQRPRHTECRQEAERPHQGTLANATPSGFLVRPPSTHRANGGGPTRLVHYDLYRAECAAECARHPLRLQCALKQTGTKVEELQQCSNRADCLTAVDVMSRVVHHLRACVHVRVCVFVRVNQQG